MDKETITGQEAYASIGKHLVGKLQDGRPEGVYISSEDDSHVWHAYVNSPGIIGASRVIIISKTTGEIVGDQMVGE